MSEEDRDLIIQRILVALDASPHSLAALEAAAELAARLKAELLGLFVEDVTLLRLTELPFSQEIGLFSTTRRQLGSAQLERQFRAQAGRMRQRLARIAGREQIPWSFRVVRGVIASELLQAALEADLLILGRTGGSLTKRRRLGSTARAILTQAPHLTLILQHGTRLGLPVVVVYDGSVAAQRALAVAAYLVQEQNSYLRVLTLARGSDEAHHLAQQVDTWLQAQDLTAHYRWLDSARLSRLAHLVQLEQGGVLILPAETPNLQGEVLLDLLDEVDCPILLVR